jgi:DNA (cytosine-5)-methyltransferase 1
VKNDVPEHDLLVGGFPCQDYSVATTKAHGIEGKKGVLWWHIHDILRLRHPKYVFLENVDRLLKSPTSQRGRDFGIILRCLADDGYYVEWRVINAAEYGFVQKRRLTYIVAARADTKFAIAMKKEKFDEIVCENGFFAGAFPVKRENPHNRSSQVDISAKEFCTLQNVSDELTIPFWNSGVMIGHKVFSRETLPNYKGDHVLLRDILEPNVADKYYISDEKLVDWKYMKGSKKVNRISKTTGFEYPYSEGAIPFPDPIDGKGRTMLTSEGTPNRSSHIIEFPAGSGMFRTLTPLECERMNGFPDNWTNTGMTDRQRYFTMGNALVVGIIQRMGERLLAINEPNKEKSSSNKPTYSF